MKHYFILIPTLLILFFSSGCWKEDNNLKDKNTGTTSALLNGEAWEPSRISADLLDNGMIVITTAIYSGQVPVQSQIIDSIKLETGKQPIDGSFDDSFPGMSQSSYYLSHGDQFEHVYTLINNEDNYISIDDINAGKIRGRYQLNYYRSKSYVNKQTQGMPDTLRFTNGSFDLEITPAE